MYKHLFTKLAATLCVPAILSSSIGCGTSVVGPERTTAVVQKSGFGQPVILPSEPALAPRGADLTGDGWVDASDLAAFAALMAADLTGDRAVDNSDQLMLGAVLNGTPIDRNGDGHVDASDIAAFAYARGRADLNRDGVVSASDVAAFAYMRGKGDVNHDGTVSSSDLTVIRQHFGQQIEPEV